MRIAPSPKGRARPCASLLLLAAAAAVAGVGGGRGVTAQEAPQPSQDPAALRKAAVQAMDSWLRSDLQDQDLLNTAVAKLVEAETAGIELLAAKLRHAATAGDALPQQQRVALDTLVSNALLGVLSDRTGSGMVYAGQYDDLRRLQPQAGNFLTSLVIETPDWFPDDMRALVIPALRDVFPKSPGPAVLRRFAEIAEDSEFEAEQLREAVGYALAGWGDRRFVAARIAEWEKNAGKGEDSDELHFVRRLAFLHYNLREYSAAAAKWQRYLAGMKALEAPPSAHDHYNAACCLALAGQTEPALLAIEACAARVAAGPLDTTAELSRRMFATDPDLRSIRQLERYQRAMQTAFPVAEENGGNAATAEPDRDKRTGDRDGAPR